MAELLSGAGVSIVGENIFDIEDAGGSVELVVSEAAIETGPTRLAYHPQRFALGVGCARNADPEELWQNVSAQLAAANIAPEAIACVTSLDLKADERAMNDLARRLGCAVPRVLRRRAGSRDRASGQPLGRGVRRGGLSRRVGRRCAGRRLVRTPNWLSRKSKPPTPPAPSPVRPSRSPRCAAAPVASCPSSRSGRDSTHGARRKLATCCKRPRSWWAMAFTST